jgi:hypothetical protein
MFTQVYDPDLFTRTRLYGIAVRKCTHPDVIAYVQQLTQSLKVSLESGGASIACISRASDQQ